MGNRAASLASAIAFHAYFLTAQSAMQGAAGTLVGIDTRVDGFMGDGGLFVDAQRAGDLFRTPRLGQFGVDDCPCFGRNTRAILTRTQASR